MCVWNNILLLNTATVQYINAVHDPARAIDIRRKLNNIYDKLSVDIAYTLHIYMIVSAYKFIKKKKNSDDNSVVVFSSISYTHIHIDERVPWRVRGTRSTAKRERPYNVIKTFFFFFLNRYDDDVTGVCSGDDIARLTRKYHMSPSDVRASGWFLLLDAFSRNRSRRHGIYFVRVCTRDNRPTEHARRALFREISGQRFL